MSVRDGVIAVSNDCALQMTISAADCADGVVGDGARRLRRRR